MSFDFEGAFGWKMRLGASTLSFFIEAEKKLKGLVNFATPIFWMQNNFSTSLER